MELAEFTALAMFQCESDEQLQAMQALLHPIIVAAVEAGDAATRDWSTVPLPSLTTEGGQDPNLEGGAKRKSDPSAVPASDGLPRGWTGNSWVSSAPAAGITMAVIVLDNRFVVPSSEKAATP